MQVATVSDGASRVESEQDIVKRHERLIRYLAIPFVAHGTNLDDLMQEGRLSLLLAARKWDESKGVKLWTYARRFVFGAMIRFVAKELAEASNEFLDTTCEEFDAVDELVDSEPSPEEIAELGENLDILEEEIDALSEQERQALWQRYGEDKGVREVALAMDIPRATASDWLQGAITKLRDRMAVRA